jgi:exodeoxyribonuclease V alpha subunit
VAEPFHGSVLEATLERITFANTDTGYIVARVDVGHGGDLVTVVGSLLGAQPDAGPVGFASAVRAAVPR